MKEQQTAILRVTEEGYVPPGVTVRARIDGTLFTASFPEELLATLEQDPKVASVEVSKRLSQID